jgi:release factor glutamine methyltransferase
LKIVEAIIKAADKLSASGIVTARLDAELLLSHVLQKDRTWVFTHAHDGLDAGSDKQFQQLILRRSRREPLQYIIGRQEFWGLEFKVTPDVLIPRPETELVVESALGSLKNLKSPTIIDLCTGSGCIAVCLAKELSSARIFAADRSEQALAVARENARTHGVTGLIRFLEGDLFEPIEELDVQEQVDIVTANPPYIETRDLPALQPEVRDYEPEIALIAGPEGTEFHQRIISETRRFLKKNGTLIMEMGIGQTQTLIAMADATGAYAGPEIKKDLAGIDRAIILHKK